MIDLSFIYTIMNYLNAKYVIYRYHLSSFLNFESDDSFKMGNKLKYEKTSDI